MYQILLLDKEFHNKFQASLIEEINLELENIELIKYAATDQPERCIVYRSVDDLRKCFYMMNQKHSWSNDFINGFIAAAV
ncbi:hypothetical protein L2E82_29624 [Cichorium intybus]|uniref:Uncharacterized protein n=1 Tax=Cichorium intybus TaxID=13427 RepID=A0ACB9CYA0_CICIN|nr:hypothetical protein L2E82_29624 [Cichorium intybus]